MTKTHLRGVGEDVRVSVREWSQEKLCVEPEEGGGAIWLMPMGGLSNDPVKIVSDVIDPYTGGWNNAMVFVPPHPLIKHWVSVLRNEQTPCAVFRSAMAELGRLLIYEACRDWLPTITGEIQTPVAVSSVEFIDPREPVMVVPILRAGLALAENASSILPATKTYHLGLRRDEETLQPSVYLNNLPEKIPEGTRVLVIDPMLATGGTIVAAIDLLVDRGVTSKQIKVVSAVAAPPALQKLSNKFPGITHYQSSGAMTKVVDLYPQGEVQRNNYCDTEDCGPRHSITYRVGPGPPPNEPVITTAYHLCTSPTDTMHRQQGSFSTKHILSPEHTHMGK
ncbi:Uracil phosphoribosyltransferase [Triticum urartu]|uniref:uracil phosphoribosyltransferase n=2 Tax=Triticinae TaxID=1648030 RepID=M8ACL7_TRIUA|nr:Uracil phosphoribosyltransferase [Triticum urartu]